MNETGKTKAAQQSVLQKKRTKKRIGDTPVQFSVPVKHFITLYNATKYNCDQERADLEKKGWMESEIVMHLVEKYPMYKLNRVIMRDKIRKYLTLASEIRESTKADES